MVYLLLRAMRSAMHQLQLSVCAYHRTLKLARTIADLAGNEHIQRRALSHTSPLPGIRVHGGG
jgi:predicted ATPase with chaperone activity